LSHA
jgi:hypothetical protein